MLNKHNWRNSLLAVSGFALIGLLFATNVDAQTENVAVEVTFVAVITIVEDFPLRFGLIDVAIPGGNTLIIAPNDALTGTGTAFSVGGTQEAADLTITATAGAGINILIDSVVLPGGADYSLGAWLCDYEAGADLPCDGVGLDIASAVATGALRVGVTLTAIAGATAGNQDGTFDVTVTYQ